MHMKYSYGHTSRVTSNHKPTWPCANQTKIGRNHRGKHCTVLNPGNSKLERPRPNRAFRLGQMSLDPQPKPGKMPWFQHCSSFLICSFLVFGHFVFVVKRVSVLPRPHESILSQWGEPIFLQKVSKSSGKKHPETENQWKCSILIIV